MIELFLRLVLKSLWVKKDRFLVAAVAILLAATIVASLLTISFDVKDKMGREMRSFGANLVVLPGDERFIDQFQPDHPDILGFVPFQYFMTEINGARIELVGTDFEAANKMYPWWHVEGKVPVSEEALVGINMAEKLDLQAGDILNIKETSFKVSGVLDTGMADDDRIFVPMENIYQVSGKKGATSIHVSVLGDIDGVAGYLESEEYRVKKIRQVADTEKELLEKTQLLMSLVAVFVLSAACLGLMSTMITGVLERTREIGLMKSLGCSNNRIAAIFFAESGIIGIIGGISGYFAGLALAQFIGMEIFNMPVSLDPVVLILTIIISILIALFGSMLPVKRAVSMDPVQILRGE